VTGVASPPVCQSSIILNRRSLTQFAEVFSQVLLCRQFETVSPRHALFPGRAPPGQDSSKAYSVLVREMRRKNPCKSQLQRLSLLHRNVQELLVCFRSDSSGGATTRLGVDSGQVASRPMTPLLTPQPLTSSTSANPLSTPLSHQRLLQLNQPSEKPRNNPSLSSGPSSVRTSYDPDENPFEFEQLVSNSPSQPWRSVRPLHKPS